MCVIIDTNVFPSVFNETSKEHERFAPITRWLTTGKGKMIYGGDKYNAELRGSLFKRILVELARRGSLVQIPSDPVNAYAAKLKRKVPTPAFNDEHIVALVAVSKCHIVCTDDKKSLTYLKDKSLYPKGMKPPRIYKSTANANLCCSKHIVDVCR